MSRMDEGAFDSFKQLVLAGVPIMPEALDELIRVARLGLWAEMHGIPALKEYAGLRGYSVYAGSALAALPTTGTPSRKP